MDLNQIKALIEAKHYETASHVDERIEAGEFDPEDMEQAILTATRIHKTERDELSQSTDGKKYTIIGRSRAGNAFYTCGKVKADHLGRHYFFITAHQAD